MHIDHQESKIRTGGSWDNLPDLFGVSQLAEYLAIGTAKAYELVRQEGFPAFRIGKSYKVSKEGLRNWINFNAGLKYEPPGQSLSERKVARYD